MITKTRIISIDGERQNLEHHSKFKKEINKSKKPSYLRIFEIVFFLQIFSIVLALIYSGIFGDILEVFSFFVIGGLYYKPFRKRIMYHISKIKYLLSKIK